MASDEDWTRAIEIIQRGLVKGHHLGGQIYVSRAGEALLDRPFGEARPGEPMSSEHLMLWLSSTKPIASASIGHLWERGLLDLDDRIVDHIPDFGKRGKQSITVRHILTHTGGFRILDVGWPSKSWNEIIDRICECRLEPGWKPGRTAGYDLSSSWFILGELVHRLDGRTFDRYVRENIFEPSGMDDSWIGMAPARYRDYGSRIAPLFDIGAPEPVALDWHSELRLTRCSPGVNGCGPIRELGRFYEMLLAPRDARRRALLEPQTVEALTGRHRVGLVDKTLREVLDWGLGFALNSARDGDEVLPYSYGRHASGRAFGHGGYRSSVAFADPEYELVVALAFNGAPDDETHRRRMQEVLTAIYEDLGLRS